MKKREPFYNKLFGLFNNRNRKVSETEFKVKAKETLQNLATPQSKRVTFSNGAEYDVLVKNINPTSTTDSISNPLARLGVGTDNILNYSTYVNEFITRDYNLLNRLYRDNWVVQNIISAVPDTITKKWFNVKASVSAKEMDKIKDLYRRTKLISKINEGMRWGRLFGGALGIIMVKGQTDNLDEPLDIDLLGKDSFLGIHIVDRWMGAAPSADLVTDPSSLDFDLPEYYHIYDSRLNINVTVHHTKVIRFIGRQLPGYEKMRELYWGESEIESVYREIIRRDTTAENIASLIFKANLSVVKVKDLDQIFAINSYQAQERFWSLMTNITQLETSMGVKVIGSEDSAEFLNYGFMGVRDMYETIMMDLAGACRIPVTKLFGRSPAGMNATGESDLQNYYDYIDEVRENQFRDIVMKLLPLIAVSCWGYIPDDLDFEFEEMKSLDELQKATIAQQKAATIMEAYNTNLITRDIAQKELKGLSSRYGVFDSIADEDIDKEKKFAFELTTMMDPLAGLSFGDNNNFSSSSDYDENNPERQFDPKYGKSALNHNNMDNLHQDSPQQVDEVEQMILSIKEMLIKQDNKKPNYKLDCFDNNNDVNKDLFFAEYDNLEKMIKDCGKNYTQLMDAVMSYSNENDCPLELASQYNEAKNKYKNLFNYKSKLLKDIKDNNLYVELLKYTGQYQDEIEKIQKEKDELKQKVLSMRDNNAVLIEFLDKLLDINRKINSIDKSVIINNRRRLEAKNKKIDNELALINNNIKQIKGELGLW